MSETPRDNGEVEFRVLGPLEAAVAGQTVPLGGPKQRAILALLVLNANEVVPRDRLIDDVWGEEPPGSGPARVRRAAPEAPR